MKPDDNKIKHFIQRLITSVQKPHEPIAQTVNIDIRTFYCLMFDSDEETFDMQEIENEFINEL